MPKGFAHPYLLLLLLVIFGASAAVLAGSGDLSGIVLGARTRKENIYQNKTGGLKITVVSPKASWDLVQYLCTTQEECDKSPTSGKWWATVSGAPTEAEGHEVLINRSDGWMSYPYIKVYAKSSAGSAFKVTDSGLPYFITSTASDSTAGFTFETGDSK